VVLGRLSVRRDALQEAKAMGHSTFKRVVRLVGVLGNCIRVG
jgi:hypothetical protein